MSAHPTPGGSETDTWTADGSIVIAYCKSSCGSNQTSFSHLHDNPQARADTWAEQHAKTCTSPQKPAGSI